MTDIIHEILSELHHLLSIAGAEDLRSAGNLPSTSPHLRMALEALAEEKAATAKWGRSKRRTSEQAASGSETGKPGISERANRASSSRGSFQALDGFSKDEIAELAHSFGIDLQVGRKDSRSRVMRRLENAVKALPEGKRQHVMAELTGGTDRQTEGWVELIKKGK
jgi:hypothetical protein